MIKLKPRGGYCVGLRVYEPETVVGNIVIPDAANPVKTDILPVLILDAHPGDGNFVSKEEAEGMVGHVGYVTARSLNRVSFSVELFIFPVEAVVTLVEHVKDPHYMELGSDEFEYVKEFYPDVYKSVPSFVKSSDKVEKKKTQ